MCTNGLWQLERHVPTGGPAQLYAQSKYNENQLVMYRRDCFWNLIAADERGDYGICHLLMTHNPQRRRSQVISRGWMPSMHHS